MNDDMPSSLETRMILDSLRKDRGYPFMRATCWFIRVVAALYLMLTLFLALALLSGSISKDTYDVVAWAGGPSEGAGAMATVLLLFGASIRVMLMLAVSECIQLMLDLRSAQSDFAATQQDMATRNAL